MENYDPLFDMSNPYTGLGDTHPGMNNVGMNNPGAFNAENFDFTNVNVGVMPPQVNTNGSKMAPPGANMNWANMNTFLMMDNFGSVLPFPMMPMTTTNSYANNTHGYTNPGTMNTPGANMPVPEASITLDDLNDPSSTALDKDFMAQLKDTVQAEQDLAALTTPPPQPSTPVAPLAPTPRTALPSPSPTPQTRRRKPTSGPIIMNPTTNRIVKRTHNPAVQAAGARLREAQCLKKLPADTPWDKLTRLQRCQLLNKALARLAYDTKKRKIGASAYGVKRQAEALGRKVHGRR